MKWVRFDSQLGTQNGDLPQAFATTQLTVCRHFTLPVTIHRTIKINYTGRIPIYIHRNSFTLLQCISVWSTGVISKRNDQRKLLKQFIQLIEHTPSNSMSVLTVR